MQDGLEESKKERAVLRERAKEAEREAEELRGEVAKQKALLSQKSDFWEKTMREWKDRVGEHEEDLREMRSRLDEAKGEIATTKDLLVQTERELSYALSREKENDNSRSCKLETEKKCTEKENTFLKEQLQEKHKLYNSLVTALKIEEPEAAREDEIIVEANKALLRAIEQGER